MGHAGSDIESGYHKQETIEETELNDPLLHSSRILIQNKCLSADDILKLYESARKTINHVCESAAKRPKINTAANVMESITANTFNRTAPTIPSQKDREVIFGKNSERLTSLGIWEN